MQSSTKILIGALAAGGALLLLSRSKDSEDESKPQPESSNSPAVESGSNAPASGENDAGALFYTQGSGGQKKPKAGSPRIDTPPPAPEPAEESPANAPAPLAQGQQALPPNAGAQNVFSGPQTLGRTPQPRQQAQAAPTGMTFNTFKPAPGMKQKIVGSSENGGGGQLQKPSLNSSSEEAELDVGVMTAILASAPFPSLRVAQIELGPNESDELVEMAKEESHSLKLAASQWPGLQELIAWSTQRGIPLVLDYGPSGKRGYPEGHPFHEDLGTRLALQQGRAIRFHPKMFRLIQRPIQQLDGPQYGDERKIFIDPPTQQWYIWRDEGGGNWVLERVPVSPDACILDDGLLGTESAAEELRQGHIQNHPTGACSTGRILHLISHRYRLRDTGQDTAPLIGMAGGKRPGEGSPERAFLMPAAPRLYHQSEVLRRMFYWT